MTSVKINLHLYKICLFVLIANLVIYLLFGLIYLALFIQDPNNYINNVNNLKTNADIFYFAATVHSHLGPGDILPSSSMAKAMVSIHVMLSSILNTGLLIYCLKKFI